MNISLVIQNWGWLVWLVLFALTAIILLRRWLRRAKIWWELRQMSLVEVSELWHQTTSTKREEERRLMACNEMTRRNHKMKKHQK